MLVVNTTSDQGTGKQAATIELVRSPHGGLHTSGCDA